MTTEFNAGDDIIDVRDVIARVEELRSERDNLQEAYDNLLTGSTDFIALQAALKAVADWRIGDDGEELATLESLLDDLKGCGGDEQWEGDWYPVTLIHENHFVDAMREMVQDIGDLPKEIPSYLEIDWEKTADNLKVDYSVVEYEGHTYWYL